MVKLTFWPEPSDLPTMRWGSGVVSLSGAPQLLWVALVLPGTATGQLPPLDLVSPGGRIKFQHRPRQNTLSPQHVKTPLRACSKQLNLQFGRGWELPWGHPTSISLTLMPFGNGVSFFGKPLSPISLNLHGSNRTLDLAKSAVNP